VVLQNAVSPFYVQQDPYFPSSRRIFLLLSSLRGERKAQHPSLMLLRSPFLSSRQLLSFEYCRRDALACAIESASSFYGRRLRYSAAGPLAKHREHHSPSSAIQRSFGLFEIYPPVWKYLRYPIFPKMREFCACYHNRRRDGEVSSVFLSENASPPPSPSAAFYASPLGKRLPYAYPCSGSSATWLFPRVESQTLSRSRFFFFLKPNRSS